MLFYITFGICPANNNIHLLAEDECLRFIVVGYN